MKIYIFGSDGMLGNYVKKYLSSKMLTTINLTRIDFDLENINKKSLNNLLISKELQEGDIIINCAGIIPQSNLNINKLYYKINSIFPIILSNICDSNKCKFIHITTDCVFSGKEGNYFENAIHDECNNYGTSKSLGEICQGTIIRTSIIGEEIKYKKSLLEWVKSNKDKEINGFVSHYWNGVTCLQLSKIIYEIIDKDLYWEGVRHIFSPNIISKYELCEIINKIYNLNIKINKLETEKVDKSLNTIYEKLFDIPEIEQQIIELKNNCEYVL